MDAIPHRYHVLLFGAACLLVGTVAAAGGLLGLAGFLDTDAWGSLVRVAFGTLAATVGIAGVRNFLEQHKRARVRALRRHHRSR